MPLMVPMFSGIVVADVLEDAGLAEGPGDAEHGHQGGEGVDVEADVEGLRAVDGGDDGEVGLRYDSRNRQIQLTHITHQVTLWRRTCPTASRRWRAARRRAARSRRPAAAATRMSRPYSPT